MTASRRAFVTLATNADYCIGAVALSRSLRAAGSRAPLLVMTLPGVDAAPLRGEAVDVVEVAPPRLSDAFRARHARAAQHAAAPFTRGTKPDFHDPLDNFAKLRLWEFEQFERLVFIDADAIVVRNVDRLLDYPEFSAAPNLYAELADMHRLNSGVFVARPDRRTYAAMLARLDAPDAFWRRTDQTFLEAFYPDWHGLPYTYNTLQYVFFNLPDLWCWPQVRIVHYQYEKPWQRDHPKAAELAPLIDLWHRVLNGDGLPERLDSPHARR